MGMNKMTHFGSDMHTAELVTETGQLSPDHASRVRESRKLQT